MASSSPFLSYSSASSPNNRRRRHQRNTSDLLSSISFMLNDDGVSTRGDHDNGLRKSRSIAAFVRRSSRVGDIAGGKKKGGFWSKLLRTKEVFTHPRTVREV